MTDISTIDIPTAVTAIFVLATTVGGVIGKRYISQALDGLAYVADLMVDVGQLLITIAKAGEDGALSPEEWTSIKEQARDIQANLLQLKGKFGSLME
jgi:hypothetical protein